MIWSILHNQIVQFKKSDKLKINPIQPNIPLSIASFGFLESTVP